MVVGRFRLCLLFFLGSFGCLDRLLSLTFFFSSDMVLLDRGSLG